MKHLHPRYLVFAITLFVCVGFLMQPGIVLSQETAPKQEPALGSVRVEENAEASATRLQYMKKHALSFKGTRELGKGAKNLEIDPVDEPLLRWANHYSDIKDGILAGWVDESGRPMAMGQICLIPKMDDQWCIEMQSLSTEKFELAAEFNGPWRPRSPGIQWKRLDKALKKQLKPAKNADVRLAQMRSFARSFRCDDDFEDSKNDLRLLTEPIFRYADPKRNIVDAATFAMVHGTDPELIILIELRKNEKDDGSEFFYALAPMTSFELNVTLNGKKIWHKPKMTSNLDTDIFWQRQLTDSVPKPTTGQSLLKLLGF